MLFKKSDPSALLEQALPVSDPDEQDNEWYQYLQQVRTEALAIDEQLEEFKDNQELHDSLASQYASFTKPRRVVPQKSKGTGIVNLDEKWKNETLNYYNSMQESLHIRREYLKESSPECLYASGYNIEDMILNKDSENQTETQNAFRYPDTDDIAKWTEGFLHESIRDLLDLYEDQWRTKKEIPYEMQMWIWSFLIMISKPLIPDLAADLNDLLSVWESIKDYQSEHMMDTNQGCTMYDSIILIITEHFEKKFKYR